MHYQFCACKEAFEWFCHDNYIREKKNSKTMTQKKIDGIKAYLRSVHGIVDGWQQPYCILHVAAIAILCTQYVYCLRIVPISKLQIHNMHIATIATLSVTPSASPIIYVPLSLLRLLSIRGMGLKRAPKLLNTVPKKHHLMFEASLAKVTLNIYYFITPPQEVNRNTSWIKILSLGNNSEQINAKKIHFPSHRAFQARS